MTVPAGLAWARRRRAIARLACAFVLAACGGPTDPPAVASVSVSPASLTLFVGPGGAQSAQVVATPQRSNGRALEGREVTWTRGSAAVVNVSAFGLVTAVAPGVTTVTATSEGFSGTVQVTVQPVPVASITV